MAKSMPSTTIALDYPLWACDFDPRDENRLVVGGGGGPGRHGVSNKIVRVVHPFPPSPARTGPYSPCQMRRAGRPRGPVANGDGPAC